MTKKGRMYTDEASVAGACGAVDDSSPLLVDAAVGGS
jgi:hypothetical protein